MEHEMSLKLIVWLVPLALGAQSPTIMCTPTCFPAQRTAYVDLLHGSDSNSGACQPHQVNSANVSTCAFQNLAAGVTALAANGIGSSLALAAGTCERWRQGLTFYGVYSIAALNHIVIGSFGPGAQPTIDGSIVLSGTDSCGIVGTNTWTLTTGTTWQTSVTTPADSLGFVNFWRNNVGPSVGLGVTVASSLSNCEATTGTYYASSQLGGTYTLYYDSGSATNPGSDGNLYEVNSIPNPINDDNSGARYLTLANITTRRNHSNDGSVAIAEYSTVLNVNANEGTKHNLLVADGSYISGLTMHNSWFGGTGTTQLVYYDLNSLGAGITGLNVSGTMDVLDGSVGVIYGHYGTGPGFGSVVWTNLSGTNEAYVLQGLTTAASNVSCSGCLSGVTLGLSATLNGLAYTSPAASGNACLAIETSGSVTASNINCTCVYSGQGCIIVNTATPASFVLNGTNTLQNTAASGGGIYVASGLTGTWTMGISGTTFQQTGTNTAQLEILSAPTTITINNNVYHYDAANGFGGGRYLSSTYTWTNLTQRTAWQALGFDAGSTWVNSTP
jgi:hypothetical protein